MFNLKDYICIWSCSNFELTNDDCDFDCKVRNHVLQIQWLILKCECPFLFFFWVFFYSLHSLLLVKPKGVVEEEKSMHEMKVNTLPVSLMYEIRFVFHEMSETKQLREAFKQTKLVKLWKSSH